MGRVGGPNIWRRQLRQLYDFYRFFAVFSGISWSGLLTWSNGLFFNPKGIGSSSPALARFIEGQRWVAQRKGFNPERVAYQRLMKEIQLFQSCDFPVNSPWVARSAQPRADRFNPFGIGLTQDAHEQRLAFHRKQRRTFRGSRSFLYWDD